MGGIREELQRELADQARRIAALEAEVRFLRKQIGAPRLSEPEPEPPPATPPPGPLQPEVAEVTPASSLPPESETEHAAVSPPPPEPEIAEEAGTEPSLDETPQPEPEPAPVAAAVTEQPAPAAAPPPPVPDAVQFMTDEEFHRGLHPPREKEEENSGTLELQLGTRWLLRIGGVLLLAGLAYAAAKIQPHMSPGMRVAGGYLITALTGGAGWFVLKRHTLAGRSTIAISIAVGFFVSFASHFIAPTRIFELAIPALLLMAAFAGSLVGLAQRWRSEAFAALGYGLGALAVLISAESSQSFALVALAVLSASAAALFLLRDWARLTVGVLIGTYACTAILWVLIGAQALQDAFAAHMGALFFHHVVFAAAFWRRSRPWIVREEMREKLTATGEVPFFDPGAMPYTRVVAILNTLALVALGPWLVWVTELYRDGMYVLLFVLAGLEFGRLAVPALRRGGLAGFHGIVGLGVFSGAVISAFAGMTESAVLAAQCLVLAVAATRSRGLRWLRPVTIIPAALAVKGYDAGAIGTTGDYLLFLLPPALLLASCMQWERIWRESGAAFVTSTPLRVTEALSAQSRSVVAAGLVLAATGAWAGSLMEFGLAIGAVTIAVLAGMRLFTGDAWMSGAALLTVAVTATTVGLGDGAMSEGILLAGIALPVLWLWDGLRHWRMGLVLIVTLASLGLLSGTIAAAGTLLFLYGEGDFSSLLLLAAGAVYAVVAFGAWKCPRFPGLIEQPSEEETDGPYEPDGRTAPRMPGPLFTLVPAIILTGAAVYDASLNNARETLIPAAAIAGILLAGGQVLRRVPLAAATLTGVALGMVICAAVVYGEGMLGLVCAAAVVCAGCALLMTALKRPEEVGISVLAVVVAALIAIVCAFVSVSETSVQYLCGLVFAAGVYALSVVVPRMLRHAEAGRKSVFEPAALRETLTLVSLVMAMLLVSRGVLFDGMFITVAWGVIGLLSLGVGFVLLDRTKRYAAMIVFALATGRILFVDLAGSDDITRIVAFIGLGTLLIVAGIGYGLLSKRLLREREQTESEQQPDG